MVSAKTALFLVLIYGLGHTQSDWSLRHPTPVSEDLNWSVWTGSMVVSVGNHGAIIKSADGLDWEKKTSNSVANLHCIAFTGEKLIAVGDSGSVLTSVDGESWSRKQAGAAQLISVLWNGSRLFAVDSSGMVFVSADGEKWEINADIDPVTGVAFNGNIFVAVHKSGGIIVTTGSSSFSDWNSRSLPYKFQWVASAGTRFIAGAKSGIPAMSSNGYDWSSGASVDGVNTNFGTWDGKRFLCVGDAGKISASSDGISWTPLPNPVTRCNLNHVLWTGVRFVAVGARGTIATSEDGLSWMSNYVSEAWLTSVIWTGTAFIAESDVVPVMSSPDGLSWSPFKHGNPPPLGDFACQDTIMPNGNPLGYLLRSSDFMNWHFSKPSSDQRIPWLAWNGSILVAVKSGVIETSPDGCAWTQRTTLDYSNPTLSPAKYLHQVLWAGNMFIAVGDHTIKTSSDGLTWNECNIHDSPGNDLLIESIAWSGTTFAAVGQVGVYPGREPLQFVSLTSSDGINWTQRKLDFPGRLNSVVWSGKQFFAVGSGPKPLVVSPDGALWNVFPGQFPAGEFNSISMGGERLVALSGDGRILTTGNLDPVSSKMHRSSKPLTHYDPLSRSVILDIPRNERGLRARLLSLKGSSLYYFGSIGGTGKVSLRIPPFPRGKYLLNIIRKDGVVFSTIPVSL